MKSYKCEYRYTCQYAGLVLINEMMNGICTIFLITIKLIFISGPQRTDNHGQRSHLLFFILKLKIYIIYFRIFTLTKYDSFYFLPKLIEIHSSVETDRTGIYF